MAEFVCWNCGSPLHDVPMPVSRHASCPKCFNDLHCCRLCRHYHPEQSAGSCNEDRAAPPVVKDNANFCDWFRPAMGRYRPETGGRSKAARARLDELFTREASSAETAEKPDFGPPTDEERARAQLERLFASKPVDKDAQKS